MSVVLVETIAALGPLLVEAPRAGVVGLVPTMGALHPGHARLIERARSDCDAVIVSIFVNPLQFDRPEDLQRYPRPLDADLAFCASLGVDFAFVPSPAEMYPAPPACTVDVGRLADHLCGHYRPGHFRGVATVVLKLFQIVQPSRAYFGEKDAQQLAIVRRMVRDLNVPVEIVGIPTVREADGLAISSRNHFLSSGEHQLATALYDALTEAGRQIADGVSDSAAVKRAAVARIPKSPELRLEYLEVVDPEEMQPVETISGQVCVAGALWVGSTRLIDNVISAPHS